MKNYLVTLALCLITSISACDIGFFVIKGRAVMKDKSVLTGFFLLDGHCAGSQNSTLLCEPDSYFLKDGTDLLPSFTTEMNTEWLFVQDYTKLPWGYFYNSDSAKLINMQDADSLIYLSEHLAMEMKRLAPWHSITTRQLDLLKQGIKSYDTAEWGLGTMVVISTRDSISNDELELYAAQTCYLEDMYQEYGKSSYHRSFFYDTTGNDGVVEKVFDDFKGELDDEDIREFKFNKAKLELLDYFVGRNLLMKPENKIDMKKQIADAIGNIDLVLSYYKIQAKKSPDTKKFYQRILSLCPADSIKTKSEPQIFQTALTSVLFPRLKKTTDTNESVDLESIGIVRLECWYNSDGF